VASLERLWPGTKLRQYSRVVLRMLFVRKWNSILGKLWIGRSFCYDTDDDTPGRPRHASKWLETTRDTTSMTVHEVTLSVYSG
jgi:hypothetical protein